MKLTGKSNISVNLITYSKSVNGKTIATFELEYPRFIHSEVMTHRVFSRNAASSRAIPIQKVIDLVNDNPAMPIHWGKNQSGMQANIEVDDISKELAKNVWLSARNDAVKAAESMIKLGVHKQVANRLLEPFQMIKTVVTSTEWKNFFNLRCHEDAQPEIKELAELMRDCLSKSEPRELKVGEWHTPYVDPSSFSDINHALRVSASCCAQVSYRLLDDSQEKADKVFKMLVESKPIHASPLEHQARCVADINYRSGNFIGWHQHRQEIHDHEVKG